MLGETWTFNGSICFLAQKVKVINQKNQLSEQFRNKFTRKLWHTARQWLKRMSLKFVLKSSSSWLSYFPVFFWQIFLTKMLISLKVWTLVWTPTFRNFVVDTLSFVHVDSTLSKIFQLKFNCWTVRLILDDKLEFTATNNLLTWYWICYGAIPSHPKSIAKFTNHPALWES